MFLLKIKLEVVYANSIQIFLILVPPLLFFPECYFGKKYVFLSVLM